MKTKRQVFLRGDIKHVLDALALSAKQYPSGEFRDGYLFAVLCLARAFGIDLDEWELQDYSWYEVMNPKMLLGMD